MFDYRYLLALAAAVALAGPAGPARADEDNMVQIVNSSSGDDDSDTQWTAKKLETVCKAKWKRQPNAIKRCIENGQNKIGKEMTPADLEALDLALSDSAAAKRESNAGASNAGNNVGNNAGNNSRRAAIIRRLKQTAQ